MHSTPSDPHTTTGLAQGDLGLLHTPVTQRLLHAPVPARLACTGHDQTPRVIPINVHWTGDELVMGAFAGTHKLPALRARPQVAVCIDTVQGPPEVPLLRGTVSMADVDGVLPGYAAAQRRVMGDGATAYLAAIDKPGLRMVRLGLRPTWVGVLDFQHRFPGRTPPPVLAALTQTR